MKRGHILEMCQTISNRGAHKMPLSFGTETGLPQLIEDLILRNIPVTIKMENGVIGYHLEGFYKCGGVRIMLAPLGEYSVTERYKTEKISSLSDLVYIHARWWESSKDRWEGWQQPDELWIPLLLEFGYIVAEEVPAKIVYKQRKS